MSIEDERVELIRLSSEYLGAGGLFNPELMEHDKVRDMVIRMRDALSRVDIETVRREDAAYRLGWKQGRASP